MMMFGCCGGWGMVFGGLLFLLLLIALIGGLVWLVVTQSRREPRIVSPSVPINTLAARETPLDILKARYAKGEISKEQFDEMKRELGV